jgi:hypothetical protein
MQIFPPSDSDKISLSLKFASPSKAFLQSVAAAAGGSPHLIAQRYRNITAALAVALKKALCNIEKRYLALCVNVPAED